MKSRLILIAGALVASLVSLPGFAQTPPAPADSAKPAATQPGPQDGYHRGRMHHAPRDCSQSRDPAACTAHREAHAKALEACKDIAGPQRQQCMHEQAQNFDCGKSANPQHCEARKAAYKECQSQSGPGFRQCVQQKMPPVDCSKAGNPQRCEQHQKAREACKDKLGPDHKACLREQFGAPRK